MLIGEQGVARLSKASVAVFGVGGVGGFAVEALARSGIGRFLLVDSDRISLSNLNRQIIATHSSLGKYKVDVMKERILDINPKAEVEIRRCFFLPENAHEFDFSGYDYIVDAVDTVAAKLEIITKAQEAKVPVISSMGAGNKLDPTLFRVADIYETTICPLAKAVRSQCKRRGIEGFKVVYSTEKPIKPEIKGMPTAKDQEASQGNSRSRTPGSIAFVPSVAGLILAGEVIKEIIKEV